MFSEVEDRPPKAEGVLLVRPVIEGFAEAVADPKGLAGFDVARAPNPDVEEPARAPKPEALNALSDVWG